MKTKLLFWSAVLFFTLGLTVRDSALFYFFAIHLFVLSIGVFLHKLAIKVQPDQPAESLPEAAESGND
jgi:hypothetical protein